MYICIYMYIYIYVYMYIYVYIYINDAHRRLLCASTATTFLVLTHCFHYCLASFNYGDSGARDVGPTC